MGIGSTSCRIGHGDFDQFFTKDKPVIFNFHGYPQTLKQILFDYSNNTGRFSVHGYMETGSTTTPFDMQVRNQTSRWHLTTEAANTLAARGIISTEESSRISDKYDKKLHEHRAYIKEFGLDPEEINEWNWTR